MLCYVQLSALAFSIARQRSTNKAAKPPGKNWPRGFQKRHPALKSRRVRAMAWERHENNIYDKVVHWFEVISFSHTTLSWRVESISGLTRFSLGISGSSSSCRSLLMDCCSCARVIWLPHSVSMLASSSSLLRPARYGLAVQRVAGHDHLRIYSIGSLRKVALLSHLEKECGSTKQKMFLGPEAATA